MKESATTNRLAQATSPYLLQHANNPVDWYPWGPEALERSVREDKPIFLSVGYSACHWCHVMAHECFEDTTIAGLMNECFINIKIDREERPDIDEIYMKAVTALSGSGGWPMSVFLTPNLQPFFGGTYFPPTRRYGRPGFPDVLQALHKAWHEDRDNVVEQAARLTAHIVQEAQADLRGTLESDILDRALRQTLDAFDPTWGGFGGAPKFPHSGDIRMLLRHHQRTGDARALHAATHTLDRMAQGGIYDQLGGGFHRYSTDEKWCIPHFEKMLYDNALLIVAYLEAFVATGNHDYARIAAESCDWALREMRTAEGGFASAQDADSEGEEGRFFAFTPDELEEALGQREGRWAALYYDVSAAGNFEHGRSALWRPRSTDDVAPQLGLEAAVLEASMLEAKKKLYAFRERRIRPGTDDKVLAAWNGLMISAQALAYQVLDDARYLQAAQRAARYVLSDMRLPDGRLYATARAGRAHIDACLDDYVFVIQALIDLYESDFDVSWLREALALSAQVQERFWDQERGGYFTTGEGHEALIARTKNIHDGALPSGTGVHALNLLRLHELGFGATFATQVHAVLAAQAALVNRHPRIFSHLLLAVDALHQGMREVVISAEASDEAAQALLRAVRHTFVPQRVVALASRAADVSAVPIVEGRLHQGGRASAYVCRNFGCLSPVEDAASLISALR